MRISVVIPCHNEAASVGKVIHAIPDGIDEIIVVDNNSTDRTAEIARELGARVVSESKKGYGAALKAGFRSATGDIIAALDGDGQYPAEKIMEIAEYLLAHNLDFISASRFPLDDKTVMPAVRRWGNVFLAIVMNVLFGLRVKDSQSGMWVFRKKILDDCMPESDGMPFSEELKIKVALNPKYHFAEYHIPYYPRSGESKLIPWKHGVMNLLYLFKLRFGI